MSEMYEVRPGYYYTKGDTWVRKCEDGRILMGISDYAQKKLKKIEYLTLPEVGETVEQGESLGEVESQKAVSDMMSPVTGEVLEINEEAVEKPGLLNTDPYESGWILSLSCEDLEGQCAALMDNEAYSAYIQQKG